MEKVRDSWEEGQRRKAIRASLTGCAGPDVQGAKGAHTPGPWRVAPDAGRESRCPIYGADSSTVAQAENSVRGLANAQLIAAAPDLAKACKVLVRRLGEQAEGSLAEEAIDLARAALAKAGV